MGTVVQGRVGDLGWYPNFSKETLYRANATKYTNVRESRTVVVQMSARNGWFSEVFSFTDNRYQAELYRRYLPVPIEVLYGDKRRWYFSYKIPIITPLLYHIGTVPSVYGCLIKSQRKGEKN